MEWKLRWILPHLILHFVLFHLEQNYLWYTILSVKSLNEQPKIKWPRLVFHKPISFHQWSNSLAFNDLSFLQACYFLIVHDKIITDTSSIFQCTKYLDNLWGRVQTSSHRSQTPLYLACFEKHFKLMMNQLFIRIRKKKLIYKTFINIFWKSHIPYNLFDMCPALGQLNINQANSEKDVPHDFIIQSSFSRNSDFFFNLVYIQVSWRKPRA